MKSLMCSVLVVVGLCAQARPFELSAWRGETLSAQVPGSCEFGAAPEGITIRHGIMKLVRYSPLGEGTLERCEKYDRVVWGETNTEGEPRVVEVTVPADAKPGVYTCGMMKVTVLDRVLPPAKEWKYYLDLWQHPWAVARIAKAEPFSPAHYAAMRPLWELLASAGQKTITTTICDLPWDHQCRDAYHSMMTDDFKLFDEYVAFCLSCGLGPDIACYSLCPWGAITDEQLEAKWGAFLDRFAAHLKEKGWYEQTIMAMDEREPEDVKKIVGFVRRHAPGMRISMAGNRDFSCFDGIRIDSYSQILLPENVTEKFLKIAAARRAEGLITTYYVCCVPVRPNTFMISGLGEAFWCGVSPAFLGLDGFLRWAWNSWPENPEKDMSFCMNWKSGDVALCYPNGCPSWRFLELRNGIATAEKVRLLREQGLFTDKLDELAKKYSVKEVASGKTDFFTLRNETLKLVNAQ